MSQNENYSEQNETPDAEPHTGAQGGGATGAEVPPAPPEPAEPKPAEPAKKKGGTDDEQKPEGDGTTFDREYVQELRTEAAGHRKRATDAEQAVEDLRRKLWGHEVAALGLLADPEDLPYDAEAAGDPEAVKAAAEALIARKPHMARTSTSGPLPDAADREPSPGGISWSAMLRGGA